MVIFREGIVLSYASRDCSAKMVFPTSFEAYSCATLVALLHPLTLEVCLCSLLGFLILDEVCDIP